VVTGGLEGKVLPVEELVAVVDLHSNPGGGDDQLCCATSKARRRAAVALLSLEVGGGYQMAVQEDAQGLPEDAEAEPKQEVLLDRLEIKIKDKR
jgi:hypothetical protein